MKFFLFSGLLLLLPAIFILRPVPIVSEEEALVVEGVVSGVYESGEKDLLIRLEGENQRFYINRMLENGPALAEWEKQLTGKTVTIKYPEYWTPLDWNNRLRHISKLEMAGRVLFNELK